MKPDHGTPNITASPNITGSEDIIQNFLTALKCWELLHSSDVLEKGKVKLFEFENVASFKKVVLN